MRPESTERLSIKGPIPTNHTGLVLLNIPALNKGSAFTTEERNELGLIGLLPPFVNTLEEQTQRAYRQFQECPTDLAKNVFCTSLKDQNEVLFYNLVLTHIKEMLKIIYTPTQGDAIERYSRLFRRPHGCYLSIAKPDEIDRSLAEFGDDQDIDYIVVTDGEAILGIGDQGIGGIGISIAKFALMTLCGGIHPGRGIAVALDVGTNRQTLLDDPLYLGNRFPRVRGEEYDNFVDKFIQSVKKQFPRAVVHFEDFGVVTARDLLIRYRSQLPCFNDDIQGTGAVSMAGITAALKTLNQDVTDTRILIYGAGSAGVGIADQIVNSMVAKGLTVEEARAKIWLIGRYGLILKGQTYMRPGQPDYALDPKHAEGYDSSKLFEVVRHYKPHILIGCSTQPGAFTEEVVKEMHSHVEHPIIFPLSNPTRLHEATPSDILKWTNGKALVATGSPFPPVDGRSISENNNCFTFPGIGLGAVLSQASLITNNMLAACIEALAAQSPILKDPNAGLLPDVSNIRAISSRVASAVVWQAVQDGVSKLPAGTVPADEAERLAWVEDQMWNPVYRPIVKAQK